MKNETKYEEVFADFWKDKKDEWIDYVKNDFLCTACSYAGYLKAMEDLTGFDMKDCLSLSGLRWTYFSSLRTDTDEAVYSYNDK